MATKTVKDFEEHLNGLIIFRGQKGRLRGNTVEQYDLKYFGKKKKVKQSLHIFLKKKQRTKINLHFQLSAKILELCQKVPQMP